MSEQGNKASCVVAVVVGICNGRASLVVGMSALVGEETCNGKASLVVGEICSGRASWMVVVETCSGRAP